MNATSSEKFEQLVQKMQAKLQRLAQRLCRDKNEAEDLIQDTLLRAYRHFEKCRDLRAFDSWVLTIARNTFIQKVSRRRRHETVSLNQNNMKEQIELVVDESAVSPYDHLLQVSMSEEIRDALSLLPPESRKLIMMIVVDGSTYSEVATRCNIPVGTVKSRINRICSKLRKAYASTLAREESLLQAA